jgi:DNA replication protein DnaC
MSQAVKFEEELERIGRKIQTAPGEDRPYDLTCECSAPETCGRSGWITVVHDNREYSLRCRTYEAMQARKRSSDQLHSTRISARFRLRVFSSMEQTADNAHALEVCKAWTAKYPAVDGEGLAITGPVGTGKTHLAAAIVNALHDRGEDVLFAYVPDLMADFRSAISSGGVDRAMDRVTRAGVLVLDDLGAERATEYVQEILPRIINRRYEDLKPVIVTTNLTPRELADQISQRAVSRLTEMCRWLSVDGQDYRRKGAQQPRG